MRRAISFNVGDAFDRADERSADLILQGFSPFAPFTLTPLAEYRRGDEHWQDLDSDYRMDTRVQGESGRPDQIEVFTDQLLRNRDLAFYSRTVVAGPPPNGALDAPRRIGSVIEVVRRLQGNRVLETRRTTRDTDGDRIVDDIQVSHASYAVQPPSGREAHYELLASPPERRREQGEHVAYLDLDGEPGVDFRVGSDGSARPATSDEIEAQSESLIGLPPMSHEARTSTDAAGSCDTGLTLGEEIAAGVPFSPQRNG